MAAGAADEVSTAIAALFSSHGQAYQALSAQAEAFQAQFVQTLNGGAALYTAAETVNVEQTLLNAINAPTLALLGRPLIRDAPTAPPSTAWANPAGPVGCCGATAATEVTAPTPVSPAGTAVLPG